MPNVTRRGHRVHYSVEGTGPTVVLLHGLLMADGWQAGGIAPALAADYRVVCIDSLGEGRSDKPDNPSLYVQSERTADVVAVLDAIDSERAHIIGYSMGGWAAVGMAKHYPHRLSSLAVGGWDIENGLPHGPTGPLTFDQFMGFARQAAPSLANTVRAEDEPAVRACFDTLSELDGARSAVIDLKAPVLLWAAEDDPYHRPMRHFASLHGIPFVSTGGNHLSAILNPHPAVLRDLQGFISSAS
ncbi:alpha/beta fold hydrolase [uncultured Brevundimonas sp.]|uniref:alpha/beta fold hydrolase n=1 Tax=uncultured Brevundimonas sp. TaxID=213418 RepID=UPI0030ECA655|tara:strand:- start:17267 stop:17995 length:729 start_codon:yes stop_codon:yes gene_type:complete